MEEITVAQASDYAREQGQHLSRSYLARAADLGKIKGRRVTDHVGRSYWLLEKADLERYLSSERKPGVKKGQKRQQKAEGGNEQ